MIANDIVFAAWVHIIRQAEIARALHFFAHVYGRHEIYTELTQLDVPQFVHALVNLVINLSLNSLCVWGYLMLVLAELVIAFEGWMDHLVNFIFESVVLEQNFLETQ